MKIVNIVNSIIGKKGNIGLRTSYIINKLKEEHIDSFSYSRGATKSYLHHNKNMGILGKLPRILNAYRIYCNKNFNNRILDIKLFEVFILRSFKDSILDKNTIVHIWENSPKLIKKFKNRGVITVLDVPIAPTKYAIETFKYYDEDIKIDYSFNIKQEQESFEIVDYIISPSFFVTNKIIELGIEKDKIFTIPFGAEMSNLEQKKFNKDHKKKGIDYCFAGTINKRKGVEYLLKAWNDKIFENDRLHLCGRLYPEIKDLLKKYNFKNIVLPGFVDTKEYFKKCDVYVFPSFLEGSSKSIYEAMSASMPCIVTDNSGSVIQNDIDGFVIEVADENLLKDKMLFFKNNIDEIDIMGKNAYNNVRRYSWEHYASNITAIYKKILENKG